jgi:hypothetical protein
VTSSFRADESGASSSAPSGPDRSSTGGKSDKLAEPTLKSEIKTQVIQNYDLLELTLKSETKVRAKVVSIISKEAQIF